MATLLQSSSLENPVDKGAWRAAVDRVTKNQTRLKRLSTYVRVCPGRSPRPPGQLLRVTSLSLDLSPRCWPLLQGQTPLPRLVLAPAPLTWRLAPRCL